MSLPVSFYHESIADNTVKPNGAPELGQWEVPIATLTAANLVAKTTLIDALRTAVAAITLGNLAVADTTVLRAAGSGTPAASNLAQRENKLLLRYHDNATFQKYRVSIPTFDLSTLPNHSEFLDLTGGVGADLKTAFEAIVVSPGNSANGVTLDSAQFVGRNT